MEILQIVGAYAKLAVEKRLLERKGAKTHAEELAELDERLAEVQESYNTFISSASLVSLKEADLHIDFTIGDLESKIKKIKSRKDWAEDSSFRALDITTKDKYELIVAECEASLSQARHSLPVYKQFSRDLKVRISNLEDKIARENKKRALY